MKKQSKPKLSLVFFLVFLYALSSHNEAVYGATTEEIQLWLNLHNEKRALHRVPSLTWSTTVADSAQAYANTCPSGHSNSGYGENLFWSTAGFNSTESVVNGWYSEETLYDYDNPGWNPDAGHFTQIVWKNTIEIGCGYKLGCPGFWTNVWVCQYNPPGNYLGQFADNVFPPDTTPPPSSRLLLEPLWLLLLSDDVVLNESSSVDHNSWKFYVINAPASYSQLKVELHDLSADIDLFVRSEADPVGAIPPDDCESRNEETSPETCVLTNSGSTNWHIGVYGTHGPGSFTIRATLLQ